MIPQDGLVAFYPFHGNAEDESDFDNHAEVNGATLVNDRFGASEEPPFAEYTDIVIPHADQPTWPPETPSAGPFGCFQAMKKWGRGQRV